MVRAIRVLAGGGSDPPGMMEFEALVTAGLSTKGLTQELEPQLAESVPSIENGLWKLLPEGRMETTWKIRPNARWHDGTPFTAADVVFTTKLLQDKELEFIVEPRVQDIEAIEAPDPLTVTVRWKRVSIEADDLFAAYYARAQPLPRHLLEEPYTANKATFTQLPYWSTDFVGTGPFKVQDWVQDSHVILVANDSYVMGRPKIDQIEVRFITSSATLVANVLAGAVQMPLGRGISLDQAADLKAQWRSGGVVITPASTPSVVFIQQRNPRPAIIGNVQFRRALYHALDRATMAQGLTAGFGTVADSGLPFDSPLYRQAEDAVVKYDFNPTMTARLLEGLGYSRGQDGNFRDADGQPLTVEIRATEGDNFPRILVIADQWRNAGVPTDVVQIPRARASDRAYRLSFPAFESGGNYGNFQNLKDLRTSELATEENGYKGRNDGGYANPQMDALIERLYLTLPVGERLEVLRSIYRQLTDQVVVMYLFRGANPTMVENRITNVTPYYFGNVQDWDLKV
jgi:peptide/nickel transport system substrate-binding protein